RSVSGKLQWTSLKEVLNNTYLQRSISHDTLECKIFTNQQIIYNPGPIPRRYTLLKHEDESVPISHVAVDGQQYPFTVAEEQLRLCIDIPSKSSVEVTIDYSNTQHYAREVGNVGYSTKVCLRRYLSEFRDNHLCRHERLLSVVSGMKKWSFLRW